MKYAAITLLVLNLAVQLGLYAHWHHGRAVGQQMVEFPATLPTVSNFTVTGRGGDFLLRCEGDKQFKMKHCIIADGHTLDEAMSIVVEEFNKKCETPGAARSARFRN